MATQEQALRKSFWNDDDGATPTVDQSPESDPKYDKKRQYVLMVAQRLAASLMQKRDIAVRARASSGIEQVWREDEAAFEGVDEVALRNRMIDYATQMAPLRTSSKGPKRSQVRVNIIRPKCEVAEGRFADIQLPTDNKNWGLKTTPVPSLIKGLKNQGQAVMKDTGEPATDDSGKEMTVAQVADANIKEAEERMADMEKEIDDQLTESDFNGECRKAIQNAARLGTGILKGPVVVKNLKKTWEPLKDDDGTVVRVLKREEDQQPASKSCSPWDIFPDPDCRDDITKAAYIWERETILPRELRDLIGVEGYFDDQILEVLKEEPTRVMVATPRDNQYVIQHNIMPQGTVYEKWSYSGDLDREDLEALGCDCSGLESKSLSACVVLVNDRPIKVMLNPLDTGENIYDFFQWTTRTGVPWGMGVAREMMWQQRIIIAAWRAMMDNAGDSSGVNIVVGEGVEPADGKWVITGKKLWRAKGEQNDVGKAFAQFQVQNNQEQLQAIIELALRFVDMETSLPMIFQGEKGELPETLGATNIMIDSANVALRSRVKLWDDKVTRPHLTRYYDWNMQYNAKEEIKGDFNVDPRGTSILLEKDQQVQSIEEVLALKQDAELKIMVDWKKALQKLLAARNLDIMNTDDEITKQEEALKKQPPPADPTLEAAKIRSQAELEKAQLVQEADMAELQFKAQEAEISRQHEIQMAQITREIKAMELSAQTGIALDKIKAQLSEVGAKLKTQVSLAQAKEVRPAPQVSEPLAEPPGRAPEGQAFQK